MTVDILDTKYTEISFDGIGVRNSQKRLAGLILDLAVMPLRQFQDELRGEFDIVQSILARRTAAVIGYWATNKHDPIKPKPSNMMSEITNATKNDVSLETFYINEVNNGLHRLAPTFELDIPDGFVVGTDDLEYVLMDLEDQVEDLADEDEEEEQGFDFGSISDYYYSDDESAGTDSYTYDDEEDDGADDESFLDQQAAFDFSALPDGTNVEELIDLYGVDVQNEDDLAALAELVAEEQAAELGELVIPQAEPEPEPQPKPEPRPRRNLERQLRRERQRQERQQNRSPQRPTTQPQPEVAVAATVIEPQPAVTVAAEVVQAEPVVAQPLQSEPITAEIVQEEPARAIVAAEPQQISEIMAQQQVQQINSNVLNITAEQAWQLIYGMMGYPSNYIQNTMLPRWQQFPAAFEKDRRYLYSLFLDSLKNSSGLTYMAGNFTFADRNDLTVDQLWNYYFSDLSQRIAPQLTAARLEAEANTPTWRKVLQRVRKQLSNISPIWIIALVIALVFDGLTTYVSLDQTPMEGPIVLVFTVLITILFQIADQMVVDYRRREAESDAVMAKFKARHIQLSKAVEGLDESSESFVQLSTQKSQTYANFKAAESNRRIHRRGRYWSARIADINVVVTAYGFAFMFLNSEEPVYALVEQIDFIFFKGAWEQVNLWVFLMILLAVTVSFVVNTAQRTEVMGWSMRRLKNEA